MNAHATRRFHYNDTHCNCDYTYNKEIKTECMYRCAQLIILQSIK